MAKAFSALMISACVVLSACGEHSHDRPPATDEQKVIRINGASTVGHVIPDLVEAFLREAGNERVRILYPGGPGSEAMASPHDASAPRGSRIWQEWQGSTWGMKLVRGGEVELGAMSRRPSVDELAQARDAGINPKLHVIAFDAIALLAHPKRAQSLRCLTRTQLRAMYLAGESRTWRDLGEGLPDAPVRPMASNPSICGTALAFAEVIDPAAAKTREPERLFASGVTFVDLSEVIDTVDADENSIGFVQYALLPANAANQVVAYLDDEDPAVTQPVLPSETTCANGTYPLQRPLILVANGVSHGAANRFLRFVLGQKGQQILRNRSCIVPRN